MEKETFSEKLNTAKVHLQKSEIRLTYLKRLQNLTEERRKIAKEAVLQALQVKLAPFTTIVSFINFSYEIDLSALNLWLLSHKKLFLPKWERKKGNQLEIYSAKGGEVSHNGYDCILVPGLAFDKEGSRVGHGKGCYDRLLTENPTAYTIGVGFKEQFSETALPKEVHDKAVKECCLV